MTSISPLSTTVALFPKVDTKLSLRVLSYLDDYELPRFSVVNKTAKDHVARTIFSKIIIFDRAHWKEYWDIEITDEYDPDKIDSEVLKQFLSAYYGKDPLGRPGRACDYCLTPAVVPCGIWVKKPEYYFYESYNLIALEKLAEHPSKGHAAKYTLQTMALEKGTTPIGASSRLVIQLKDVIGRGRSWSKESQKQIERGQVQILNDLFARTGWGCLPDALSQNTVVFAHHAITGECPLGNADGVEGRWTYARTAEQVAFDTKTYQVFSGGFSKNIHHSEATLNVVYLHIDSPLHGVAVLKKF